MLPMLPQEDDVLEEEALQQLLVNAIMSSISNNNIMCGKSCIAQWINGIYATTGAKNVRSLRKYIQLVVLNCKKHAHTSIPSAFREYFYFNMTKLKNIRGRPSCSYHVLILFNFYLTAGCVLQQ